ncbi:MAG: Hint domain-containing protein [Pseudomonadota bacterium]
MPFYIAVYDWSLYTTPAALSTAELEGDTHPNNPGNPGYNPGDPNWLGETFTFNGGASTLLAINDDDAAFEDGYAETGGAATLDQDVVINGVTYFAGAVIENEFSMLDADGNEVWVIRIDGTNVGFGYPSGAAPSPGDDFVGVTGRDGSPADSDDATGSTEDYATMMCFTPGAMIATPQGQRDVAALAVGDLVETVDDGAQPIRWISRRVVQLTEAPDDARPVLIHAGAFAPGRPAQDMVVSPQHRFVFQDLRGTPTQAFVAAKALTALSGVRHMRGRAQIEYIHFALPRHAVVTACGVLSESYFLAPAVYDAASLEDRAAICAAFPQVNRFSGRGYGPMARPTIRVRHARDALRCGRLRYVSPVGAFEEV